MTFENIFVGTFMFLIFLGLIGLLLAVIKYAILYPLSCYYTKRGTNKLQWKACETSYSRERRINEHKGSNMANPEFRLSKVTGRMVSVAKACEFYLEWRILPSELPYIIRVYGYNDWESFRQEEHLMFRSEQEFKDFVSDFKTLKDLREYYNKVDDKIVWYEP